jgi:hypothetical protein
MNNYFEAEPAIVARIQEKVSELKAVYTPFSVADITETTQDSPVAYVIYAGDLVVEDANAGIRNTIGQKWLVVLAVRSAKSQLKNTMDARTQAGDIIPKLLDSLRGWAPVEWMRPLRRVSGCPPNGFSPTFAYFPFMFEGRFFN